MSFKAILAFEDGSVFYGKGFGKELVKLCIGVCEKNFDKQEIKISAQAYLEKFYIDLGFERRGEGYIEDGIPHCAMFITP